MPTLDEINELCREIAEETMEDNVTALVEDLEELEFLELQKQYEFMQYAEDAADLDAEFYGVA